MVMTKHEGDLEETGHTGNVNWVWISLGVVVLLVLTDLTYAGFAGLAQGRFRFWLLNESGTLLNSRDYSYAITSAVTVVGALALGITLVLAVQRRIVASPGLSFASYLFAPANDQRGDGCGLLRKRAVVFPAW
jgi:hypothetical protein